MLSILMRNQTLICSRCTVTDSPKNIHQRCQYKTICAFGCFTVQSRAPARTFFAINVAHKDEDHDDDGDEEEEKIFKVSASKQVKR